MAYFLSVAKNGICYKGILWEIGLYKKGSERIWRILRYIFKNKGKWKYFLIELSEMCYRKEWNGIMFTNLVLRFIGYRLLFAKLVIKPFAKTGNN